MVIRIGLLVLLAGTVKPGTTLAQDLPARQLRVEVGRYTMHDPPPFRGGRPSGVAFGVHHGWRVMPWALLDLGLTQGFGTEPSIRSIDPAQDRDRSFNFTAGEASVEVQVFPAQPLTVVAGAGVGLIQEGGFDLFGHVLRKCGRGGAGGRR